MRIILVDRTDWREQLYPLTWTRPAAELRIGILSIAEKWSKHLNGTHTYLTEDYLSGKFPCDLEGESDFLLVRGNCYPDERLIEAALKLQTGEAWTDSQGFLMARADREGVAEFSARYLKPFKQKSYPYEVFSVNYPEDIFLNNGDQIKSDYELLTAGRVSAALSSTNRILGDQVFAEEGVHVECSVLNSLQGPIYLAKNSEIWENCAVRGPFALCKGAQLKMGARVYSNVTVGPYSRVGGEMNTCVIQGYSSKGHDGYLGSAVMGEWCNWGADTNNSNLKNNYKPVKVYDYRTKTYRNTGLQFYGLIMGDHSKCAINTAFNTGTVVGVGTSIFGAEFPPTYIPDFSWGGAAGFEEYRLENMLETAALAFARRNRSFDDNEAAILRHVFNMTKDQRTGF